MPELHELSSNPGPALLLSRMARGTSRNVIGFGIGQKHRHGRWTGTPALIAYVREKLPADQLSPDDRVPHEFTVGTTTLASDVVPFTATPGLRPGARAHVRPVRPGSYISASDSIGGAFGAVVLDNTDGSRQILTALSVVATDLPWRSGSPVFQPTPDAAHRIGTLTRAADISTNNRLYPSDGTQRVHPFDAALVRPGNDADVVGSHTQPQLPRPGPLSPLLGIIVGREEDSRTGRSCYVVSSARSIFSGLDIRMPGNGTIGSPSLEQPVQFVGVADGLTSGTVISVGVTMSVGYPYGWTAQEALIGNTFLVAADTNHPIDIGSAVYGFAGNTVRPRCVGCNVAADLQTAYDVDLSETVELADYLRDQYVMRTFAGAVLVQLIYKNEDKLKQRLLEADPTPTERRYAQVLHDKYAAMVREHRDEGSTRLVPIGAREVDDVSAALYGLSRLMTNAEYLACVQLLEIFAELEGRTVAQCMQFMDEPATLRRVMAILRTLDGWDLSYDELDD